MQKKKKLRRAGSSSLPGLPCISGGFLLRQTTERFMPPVCVYSKWADFPQPMAIQSKLYLFICKPSIFIHYLTICYCWFVVELLFNDVTKNRKEVKTIKFFPVPDTDMVTPFKMTSKSMSLLTPLSCPIGAETRRAMAGQSSTLYTALSRMKAAL